MKNKMTDLNNALFVELETLQDTDSYYDEDGKFNQQKAEFAVKRADAVTNVAGKISDLMRLQLDAVKTANSMGIITQMPENLGIEEVKNGNTRKALGTARY